MLEVFFTTLEDKMCPARLVHEPRLQQHLVESSGAADQEAPAGKLKLKWHGTSIASMSSSFTLTLKPADIDEIEAAAESFQCQC